MHGAVRQQTGPVRTGLAYDMADIVRVVCYCSVLCSVLFLCFQRIGCLNDSKTHSQIHKKTVTCCQVE